MATTKNIKINKDTWVEITRSSHFAKLQNQTNGQVMHYAIQPTQPTDIKHSLQVGSGEVADLTGLDTADKVWVRSSADIELVVIV